MSRNSICRGFPCRYLQADCFAKCFVPEFRWNGRGLRLRIRKKKKKKKSWQRIEEMKPNFRVGTSLVLVYVCEWLKWKWKRRHNDTRFRCLIDLSKITFITLTYERTEKIIKWSTHTSAHIIHLQSAFSICQCFYSFVSVSCRFSPSPLLNVTFYYYYYFFFTFYLFLNFRKPKAWHVAHKCLAMLNSKLTKIISNKTRARWLGWDTTESSKTSKLFEGHSYIYNAQQFGHDSKEKMGKERESDKEAESWNKNLVKTENNLNDFAVWISLLWQRGGSNASTVSFLVVFIIFFLSSSFFFVVFHSLRIRYTQNIYWK